MNYVHNASRQLRSHLRSILGGDQKLYILSPKQTGRVGWWYATIHHGRMIRLGKKPAATRDIGRAEAVNRFGVTARELRAPARKKAA